MGEPQLEPGVAQTESGILPAHGGCDLELTAFGLDEGRLEPEIGSHQDQHLPPVTGATEDIGDGLRIPDQVACQGASNGIAASIMNSVPYTGKLCFRTP